MPERKEKYLNKNNLPTKEGIYLARGVWGSNEPQEIDVYPHPIKGLCCFSEDFGSAGTAVDDRYDCHVSVQCTGLEFTRRVRGLNLRFS